MQALYVKRVHVRGATVHSVLSHRLVRPLYVYVYGKNRVLNNLPVYM